MYESYSMSHTVQLILYDVPMMLELEWWGQNQNNSYKGSMDNTIIPDYFLIANNSFITSPVSIKSDIYFIWLL